MVNTYNHGGPGNWRTGYAGIAHSSDGNTFARIDHLKWLNNEANSDPYQMWTMQRDGNYVYVFSVRAGRQEGPLMLRRVLWDMMFDMSKYESWNGASWGGSAAPLLQGPIGEPSVRRLSDGVWAMSYLSWEGSTFSIVSRSAPAPTGPWSEPKTQVTAAQEPGLYGGAIHPWSTSATGDLHMMVSKWQLDGSGVSVAYHVTHYAGTL